jgi:hypothetical protein
MKVNYVILLVALLTIPFCVSEIYSCDDKAILKKNFELRYSADNDYTGAYNKVSSCATLSTTNTGTACCYIKLKFKNEIYDEKFTHKGCIEVSLADYLLEDADFDKLIDETENSINTYYGNKNITVDKLSIDCSSKFIQLAGISLLLLLL